MTRTENLPVAIIGAGPIGLAAAAHLAARGIDFRVYESGAAVGANIADWGHVRIFTTWAQSIDPVARQFLEGRGWAMPPAEALPTGAELLRGYLLPLAAVPELAGRIETGARVVAIARQGIDKVASKDRGAHPFLLRIRRGDGTQRTDQARIVIDASGTWQNPNPLGAAGWPAAGETACAAQLAYGMPDVLGAARCTYAGKRVAVVGGGYSAINVLLDLARLAEAEPQTTITWLVRGRNLGRIYGGGESDQLPARGALGWRLKQLVDGGRIALVTGFASRAVDGTDGGVVLTGDTAASDSAGNNTTGGEGRYGPFDRVVVATGQRPDLALTRELRLDLDPWLESVRALGPLIDPNLHSCGSVPPHGHRETSHPEPGFYTIGVKSYGRAPTFLLLTGYEQARSVAAAIAGDLAAADDVRLVLPETGICVDNDPEAMASDAAAAGACCGGPAPAAVAACCVADAAAKSQGKSGCGCGPAA